MHQPRAENLDSWLTCVDAEEDDKASCRVYSEGGGPELLQVQQASRNAGRRESAPYRLRLFNTYSHINYVRNEINTTFMTPKTKSKIDEITLIVHLKL